MRLTRLFAAAAGAALLGGCAAWDTPGTRFGSLDATVEPILQAGAEQRARLGDEPPATERPEPQPRAELYPGSGRMVGQPPAAGPHAPPYSEGPEGVTLSFNDAPLPQVVQTILGDLLGENYSIEPGLSGSVTMETSRPIQREALLEVLESIVAVHGAGIRRSPQGTYRVGPRPLLQGLTPLSGADAQAPGYAVRVVADTENNNLLILGDATAYRVIVNALRTRLERAIKELTFQVYGSTLIHRSTPQRSGGG